MRNHRIKPAFGLALPLAAALALSLAACRLPTGGSSSGSTGSLAVRAAMGSASSQKTRRSSVPARTCFPIGVDLTSVSYTLTLTNASPDSPIAGGTSATGSFAAVANVPVGTWTATVDAIDAGVTIGTGSTTVVVSAGATASATVNLAPPSAGTGTLSVGAAWPYMARPSVVITPINPTGTATGDAPTVEGTSYTNGFSLPGGEYLVELGIATGAGTTTQTTVSEIAYILPGRTTDFRYYGDSTSWKDGAPAAPTLIVSTGNNGTDLNYAYVSWSGGTGATSYSLSQQEATTAAGFAGGTTIAGSVVAADYSYGSALDNNGGGGLDASHYFRYTLALTSASGDSVFVTADAPRATLTMQNAVSGGTATIDMAGTPTSGSFLPNMPINVIETGGTFSHWALLSGSAEILGPTTQSAAVFLISNATVEAQ